MININVVTDHQFDFKESVQIIEADNEFSKIMDSYHFNDSVQEDDQVNYFGSNCVHEEVFNSRGLQKLELSSLLTSSDSLGDLICDDDLDVSDYELVEENRDLEFSVFAIQDPSFLPNEDELHNGFACNSIDSDNCSEQTEMRAIRSKPLEFINIDRLSFYDRTPSFCKTCHEASFTTSLDEDAIIAQNFKIFSIDLQNYLYDSSEEITFSTEVLKCEDFICDDSSKELSTTEDVSLKESKTEDCAQEMFCNIFNDKASQSYKPLLNKILPNELLDSLSRYIDNGMVNFVLSIDTKSLGEISLKVRLRNNSQADIEMEFESEVKSDSFDKKGLVNNLKRLGFDKINMNCRWKNENEDNLFSVDYIV